MTMTNPITPPPELFKQWEGMPRGLAFDAAYRAGADQDLEACCEWLARNYNYTITGNPLRAARRPKPPSLKEQALQALKDAQEGWRPVPDDCDIIRRALESLDD